VAVPFPPEMPADTGCFVRVFVQRFLERRLEGVGADLAPKRAMEAAAKSPTAEQPAGVCQRRLRVFVQTVLRPAIVKGFVVPPKRWIVERTCGWLGRYRRHVKDYRRNATSSEELIAIAMTRKMLRRLASDKGQFADTLPELWRLWSGATGRNRACRRVSVPGEMGLSHSVRRRHHANANAAAMLVAGALLG